MGGVEVRDALGDIGIRRISRWIFNCYIVDDGGAGGAFVVDPGLASTSEGAWRELRRAGRASPDVALIAATHCHSDHVGGVPRLHVRTGAPVALGAKVRDYLAGELPRSPGLREILKIRRISGQQPFDLRALAEFVGGAGRQGSDGKRPFRLSCPVHGWLAEGERLPGAPDWEVLHTPGHTDCSICLYNAETRTLLSGDTVLTLDGRAWFNPEVVDLAAMDATEARLRALPIEHILPGHGLPISGANLMGEAWSCRETPGATPAHCPSPQSA